jgi:23S rRNA maturation-related 3'-5' exoribonuclease YhaM
MRDLDAIGGKETMIHSYPRGEAIPINIVKGRLQRLVDHLPDLALRQACEAVFTKDFFVWPGSVSKHHVWEGGLAQHVLEVTDTGKLLAERGSDINTGVVVASCLWHDFGKLWDIVREGDAWGHGDHYQKIYHIYRSAAEWEKASKKVAKDIREAVTHCILAHHGERKYGSPVEPQSREARIVHYSDMMSAWVYQDHPAPKGHKC